MKMLGVLRIPFVVYSNFSELQGSVMPMSKEEKYEEEENKSVI